MNRISLWLARLDRANAMSKLLPVIAIFALAAPASAATIWEDTFTRVAVIFTGPIAKAVSLIALVVGGLSMAVSEGDSKRQFAGLLFGIGMAMGAAQLLLALF